MNLLVYGPYRSPNTIEQLGPLLNAFKRKIVVRYPGTYAALPSGVSGVEIQDPGAYRVQEFEGTTTWEGLSNSRRQFVAIGVGLNALIVQGASSDEVVCILRSDLTVFSQARARLFFERSGAAIENNVTAEVSLTTNSVNPFSFTGHGIHISDWASVCTIERAKNKIAINPEEFSSAAYTGWQRRRKGLFCYGAFSAEELLTLGNYKGPRVIGRMNSLTIPFDIRLKVLRDYTLHTPSDVGLRLDKWRYLYDCAPGVPHPFGPGLTGLIRRYLAYFLFYIELLPPSGPMFWVLLISKSLVSWMAQPARHALLSLRALLT